jgi:predicted nucleotidyltransferase
MPKAEAIKIAKKYADNLKKNKYPFEMIYLFGSFASGKDSSWSDIDIAVVSTDVEKKRDKARLKLWLLREGIDDRIEPHGFSPKEFKILENPFVYEIRSKGIRIV